MVPKNFDVSKAKQIQIKLFIKFLKVKGYYSIFKRGFELTTNHWKRKINVYQYLKRTYPYENMYNYIDDMYRAKLSGLITYDQRQKIILEWCNFVDRYKKIKKSNYKIYQRY
jgi:hypothetical protein